MRVDRKLFHRFRIKTVQNKIISKVPKMCEIDERVSFIGSQKPIFFLLNG